MNGFGIGFLLALTMVMIFLKFVRVFTPTPAVEMVDRRGQIPQRSAMADANALDR